MCGIERDLCLRLVTEVTSSASQFAFESESHPGFSLLSLFSIFRLSFLSSFLFLLLH